MSEIFLDDPNVISLVGYEDPDDAEVKEYSTYFYQGGDYIPSTNCKVVNKLPSGVYKVEYSKSEFILSPVTLNTDDLIALKDSYTGSILSEISDFWSKNELYKQHKLSHKRGILLAGPAGCGKSSLITLLIQQLLKMEGIVFLINNFSDFKTVASALNKAIRKIEPLRPIITVIEDVDKMIESNNGDDADLLDFMDGKSSIEHHLIILTTNNASDLSPALLRPSRVDSIHIISYPDASTREAYFKFKKIPEELIKDYVTNTENLSFADLKETFIGTVILGKPLDSVVKSIRNPYTPQDYLNKSKRINV